MVLFRDDRDCSGEKVGIFWELLRIKCDTVLLAEYSFGTPSGVYKETSQIDFLSHCSLLNSKTPMEKEHGKIVDFRWEPYHDVYVYEDGYEDRYYIGD